MLLFPTDRILVPIETHEVSPVLILIEYPLDAGQAGARSNPRHLSPHLTPNSVSKSLPHYKGLIELIDLRPELRPARQLALVRQDNVRHESSRGERIRGLLAIAPVEMIRDRILLDALE